jgi:hypothetical protein
VTVLIRGQQVSKILVRTLGVGTSDWDARRPSDRRSADEDRRRGDGTMPDVQ